MILGSRVVLRISLVASLILIGCSHSPRAADDPLKNTRKLVAEGHASLYNNGAFGIPTTEIKLIPAGPSAVDLAGELVGIRARESFQKALAKARNSVVVVGDETKALFHFAGRVREEGVHVANAVTQWTRPRGKLIISKSYADGVGIAGRAFEEIEKSKDRLGRAANGLIEESARTADQLSESASVAMQKTLSASKTASDVVSASGQAAAAAKFTEAKESIVLGYTLRVPEHLREYRNVIKNSPTLSSFGAKYQDAESWRQENSDHFKILVRETGKNYFSDAETSFGNAGREFSSKMDAEGISFASLRAARWVLQGLFWDSVVAPVGKLTYGGFGYLTVNGLAYPVMLASGESVATVELAVEVIRESSGLGYSCIAPVGSAALAGLLGVAESIGAHVSSGMTRAGGGALGGASYLGAKSSSVAVRSGGYVAGKTIQFVGVPLSIAGIAVGGSAAGVVFGVSEASAGAVTIVAGEAANLGVKGVSYVGAGVIAGGGTALSVAKGAAVGVYEVSKAVVVPTGYGVGAGAVIGSTALSHLAAHTVLAAADFSYMVLSLEGPRWVLYAVKGKANSGTDLVPGTIVDLGAVQKSGDDLAEIPVSNDELNGVLNSFEQDLLREQERRPD